jgi:pyridoxamine 5'-phosphate oxidase
LTNAHGQAKPGRPPYTRSIDPLIELRDWIEEARTAGLAQPASFAFVTVGADGSPSARTVNLKRIEPGALVFTSAMWNRKARELGANPRVSLLFHWPSLGRQVHVAGEAAWAERALAEELFDARDLHHQLQTVVSRQGEPIEDLAPLRDRLDHLVSVQETPPRCPDDWGALRIHPIAIEFWAEAEDRLHERRLFERDGEAWRVTLLSP